MNVMKLRVEPLTLQVTRYHGPFHMRGDPPIARRWPNEKESPRQPQ